MSDFFEAVWIFYHAIQILLSRRNNGRYKVADRAATSFHRICCSQHVERDQKSRKLPTQASYVLISVIEERKSEVASRETRVALIFKILSYLFPISKITKNYYIKK